MSKIKIIFIILLIVIISLISFHLYSKNNTNNILNDKEIQDTIDNHLFIEGLVIYKDDNTTYIVDKNQVIYKFSNIDITLDSHIKIYYENEISNNINDYLDNTNNIVKIDTLDTPFHLETGYTTYQKEALNITDNMSLDELIGQLYMVHFSSTSQKDVDTYYLSGYVFFASAFKNKDKEEVIDMINSLQEKAKIPLLTSVDEEGGSIVRISSNSKLYDGKFLSPRELYQKGGFTLIKEDTLKKIDLLSSLGLNVNLAPVLDMSNNKDDYIYARSIGLNSTLTGEYAKTVIESSLGSSVSFVMKHFPGYASNSDTHKSSSLDTRSLEQVLDELIPFKMGIDSLGEAIMVSHNTVEVIDKDNPASLSTIWHNYLRSTMNFKGMIITDALNMGATKDIENIGLKGILAGNDILITKNYKEDISNIKEYINNNNLSSLYIKELATKVIEWKYYKGLLK